MSLLVRRCLSRSHQLEEYVETWQIDHKEAMYARDLEELIKECFELAPLLRRAWHLTFERLFDENERSDRVFAGEEVMKGAIRRAVRMVNYIAKMIVAADKMNYSIDGSGVFKDTVRDLELLEKEAESQWPPMDSQRMKESIADFESGDYQSTEDMLRGLQDRGAR